jgi:hypothetical protein
MLVDENNKIILRNSKTETSENDLSNSIVKELQDKFGNVMFYDGTNMEQYVQKVIKYSENSDPEQSIALRSALTKPLIKMMKTDPEIAKAISTLIDKLDDNCSNNSPNINIQI